MKKTIFIDESIYYYLLFDNNLKKEIYEQLRFFILDHFEFVSSVYSILKIQQIFIKENQLESFFDFFNDISELIKIFYPIELNEFKEAFVNYKKDDLPYELIYYCTLLKKHSVEYLYSFKFRNYAESLKKKHDIHLISPNL